MFPKIGVSPKWMVYNGKPYEQMDDLGVKPLIFGNTQMCVSVYVSFEPRKKPSYFLLYWMVNRDPYNGLL